MCIDLADILASQTMLYTEDSPRGLSAVDYYFIQDDGSMFKTTAPFEPYFLVSTKVCALKQTKVREMALILFGLEPDGVHCGGVSDEAV